MKAIDFDKKAERYHKRKNKAIAKAYPMFADEFSISQEDARDHVEDDAWRAERYLEYLEEVRRREWFRVELYKRYAFSIGQEDIVIEAYEFYEHMDITDTSLLLDKICCDLADRNCIARLEMWQIINVENKHLMPKSYKEKTIYH